VVRLESLDTARTEVAALMRDIGLFVDDDGVVIYFFILERPQRVWWGSTKML
jgi:hypothetical protein